MERERESVSFCRNFNTVLWSTDSPSIRSTCISKPILNKYYEPTRQAWEKLKAHKVYSNRHIYKNTIRTTLQALERWKAHEV
jgi:hypothetical protein